MPSNDTDWYYNMALQSVTTGSISFPIILILNDVGV